MKPLPWSRSSLDVLLSCERKYYAEKIAKTVPFEQSEMQIYGLRIHKAFEDYQRDPKNHPLPADMRHHQPFMDELQRDAIGPARLELRGCLDTKLEPVEIDKFWRPLAAGTRVWWRGQLDYDADVPASLPHLRRARIVDYKTGKEHSKLDQLHDYARWKIIQGYDEVEVMYYWTQTRQTAPRIIIPKEQFPQLMKSLMPQLRQYVAAHHEELWRPRKNGLCKKYCGVMTCEFNGRA